MRSRSGFPSPSSLASRLSELVAACVTGLWSETREPDEAIREIAKLTRSEHWRLATWDCDAGLTFPVAGYRERLQLAARDVASEYEQLKLEAQRRLGTLFRRPTTPRRSTGCSTWKSPTRRSSRPTIFWH